MKLDEVRFKRTSIQMQFAMMVQSQQEGEPEEDEPGSDFDVDKTPSNPGTERKLKKS
jgi:hypothetical protein